MSFEIEDLNVEAKAITVRAAIQKARENGYSGYFSLAYKDQEGRTQHLYPPSQDEDVIMDMIERLRPTALYYQANQSDTYPHEDEMWQEFCFTFGDWWDRRAQTYGWLNDMLNRRDYDPLENYDRKEDGGWKDTTDVGARSGTDVKGSATNTETSTPGVTETVTSTPRVEETVTETPDTTRERTTTPGVTDTVTETPNTTRERTTEPGVTETVTETPAVTETVTETPAVTETVTETPAVTDTTVETPRVAVQTVSTPGVATKTSKSVFGDNSATAVPLEETTVGPVGGGSDTTTVTPTTGTNQTQVSHSGTNQTVTGRTGTNQTVTGRVGTNQTVTGRTGEDVETETMTGSNTTVTEHEGEDVETETMTGTNTTVTSRTGTDQVQTVRTGSDMRQTVEGQRSDSHTEAAAQDVVTRLYQQYRVHGNIGVMAVSDMLTKELGLRKGLDLVKMAINEFLDLYTFYLA